MSRILIGMILILGIGFATYYFLTSRALKNLTETNTELKITSGINQATITQLEIDIVQFERLNSELTSNLQSAERYRDRLSQTLREHDLTRNAYEKPGLIEGIVNDATSQVFSDLESITAN
jgi:FtsZ-binding cell division protein ZapB